MGSTLTADQESALAAHRRIDFDARTSDRPFVSGWETSHGVSYEHLAPLRAPLTSGAQHLDYSFLADDEQLRDKVRDFRRKVDGHFPVDSEIFVGAGSSPPISSTSGFGDTLSMNGGFLELPYPADMIRMNILAAAFANVAGRDPAISMR
ncbi:hypothetical protein D5S18_26995 [Nocardia panacis]|uniref:Uncharacterized protein n=1 Tax=Nocardia panacis TaxID=2340916 RepID=A0A3A4JPA9_9NOCA|nr:hypothetical protein [Nocardia panacis]RJO70838.1 hypothetical protein D5S18_26995 [Nocardia panacis]